MDEAAQHYGGTDSSDYGENQEGQPILGIFRAAHVASDSTACLSRNLGGARGLLLQAGFGQPGTREGRGACCIESVRSILGNGQRPDLPLADESADKREYR
ncbi:hypothetical protein D3C73_1283570 [compost metagenome]